MPYLVRHLWRTHFARTKVGEVKGAFYVNHHTFCKQIWSHMYSLGEFICVRFCQTVKLLSLSEWLSSWVSLFGVFWLPSDISLIENMYQNGEQFVSLSVCKITFVIDNYFVKNWFCYFWYRSKKNMANRNTHKKLSSVKSLKHSWSQFHNM